MKRLFFLLSTLTTICLASAETPQECAGRAFPKAGDWQEYRLSAETKLMRGTLNDFHYMTAHMYCAIRTQGGIPRLSAVYAVAADENQFARFKQQGEEILAYHQNGTLLSRMRLWDTPPAAFSPAPDIVQFRFVGVEPDYVLCEAENLTRFPVVLRQGKMHLKGYKDDKVEGNFPTLQVTPCTLPPRQKHLLRLQIISKKILHLTGLQKQDRVEFVYLAADKQPVGKDISPARILPTGLPDLGETGYEYPIRLRDDLAVLLHHPPAGYVQFQLRFYQRRNGAWYHLFSKNITGRLAPHSYECREDNIRILDYEGSTLHTVRIPRAKP